MLNLQYLKTIKSNKKLNYKNLKLFIINWIINNSVYQLNLFNLINGVFLVFYLWFLHLNNANFMLNQRNDKLKSIVKNENENENEYFVNEIFNFRVNHKKNNSTIERKDCLQY